MGKIPKVIHFCWFGNNPLPKEYQKYIESWKRYMPDYKIIKWDESNYNVTKCNFVKEAYESKKWAFVSDYARLDIIYNYGGIYLDTDVEVIKSFEQLLCTDCFMGFENSGFVATGLGFGAVKNHPFIKENLEYYENIHFLNDDGSFNMITCPKITTELLEKKGLIRNKTRQTIENIEVFPPDYFCPLNYYNGNLKTTKNTYSIHRYSMSWLDKRSQKWHKVEQRLEPLVGVKGSKKVVRLLKVPEKIIIRVKSDGIKKTTKFYFSKIRRK